MANNDFFQQRPSVAPTIYAYELPGIVSHKGYLKVGYTDRDVETRINEQLHTSGLPHKTMLTVSAMRPDGNGPMGRLILFKECLRNGIIPFIIDEDLNLFYSHGLHEWKNERGYLRDTCLAAQDKFKAWLEYFRVPYK